jgi:UDP-N-acetylmuramoyl-tripeptide--D-alanyl-D-alanine ligase
VDSRKAVWIADTVGGELLGDSRVSVGPDVVIDSRQAKSGALFAAIAGERVDGHSYVQMAASCGASAALVTRRVDANVTQIIVPDVVGALSKLAGRIVRDAQQSGLLAIGVTGSTGKTSTKDLLAQVLGGVGETVASKGSQNNEIGVPLTAARVDSSTRFLVSEMGSRGVGHISQLAQIVPPDISLVVNVGVAHVGEFGSRDVIAQAKGELVQAARSWAVLNAQDELVAQMRPPAPAQIAGFALGAEPGFGDLRVWATDIQARELEQYSFFLKTSTGARERVQLQVTGAHQVSNATAAAAAALCAGLELDQVAAALSQAKIQSPLRMQLEIRADGLLVLNDSYNANPDSMRAALAAAVGLRRAGGKVIAVLGDMLELGGEAAGLHTELGAQAAHLGIDHLIAVGEFGSALAAGVAGSATKALLVADVEEATKVTRSLATPSDVVLVKASRGLALERVASGLIGRED